MMTIFKNFHKIFLAIPTKDFIALSFFIIVLDLNFFKIKYTCLIFLLFIVYILYFLSR